MLDRPSTVLYLTLRARPTSPARRSSSARASIVDSFQYKFRTIVPEDCIGDREEDSHRNNLRDVGRRYCDVTNCDAVIAWLEGRNGETKPVDAGGLRAAAAS